MPMLPSTVVLVLVGMIIGLSVIVVALLSRTTSERSNTAREPCAPTKRAVVPPALVVRPQILTPPTILGRALRDWNDITTSPGPAERIWFTAGDTKLVLLPVRNRRRGEHCGDESEGSLLHMAYPIETIALPKNTGENRRQLWCRRLSR